MREQEKQRPPTGLVKVVCLPFDRAAALKHGQRKPTDARFETMLGRSFIPGSWSAWIAPVQALLLLLDDVLVGTTRLVSKASHFTLLVLLLYLTLIYSPWKEASNIQLQPWLFQNQWGSH